MTDTFFGGEHDESFSETDPEEYIARVYDENPDLQVDALEVFEFRRREVPETYLRNEAGWLAERFHDNFDEEFGGEDGCFRHDEAAALEELEGLLVPILKAHAEKHASVWQCEQVGSRVWTKEEVAKVVSEWFASPNPAAAPAAEPVEVVSFPKPEAS